MGHQPATPAVTPPTPTPAPPISSQRPQPQLNARASMSSQAAANINAAAASSSSISAPVSPSASFASLEALRYSLAMRSGNLDLDQSAHTFPIQDQEDRSTPAALRTSAGPSAPTRSASTSAATSAPTRPPTFFASTSSASSSSSSSSSSHRSSGRNALEPVAEQVTLPAASRRMAASPTSSAFALPSLTSSMTQQQQQQQQSPPPIPPPLSLGNLPCPRSYPSPYQERRISPFHEGRGMSFTPATTPPPSSPFMANAGLFDFDHDGPAASTSTSTSTSTTGRSRRRRHRSGSASGSIGPGGGSRSGSVRSHGSVSLGSSRSSSPVHFRADGRPAASSSSSFASRGSQYSQQHTLDHCQQRQRTRSRASSDASGGAAARSTPSTRNLPSASPESLRIQTLPVTATTRPPIPIPLHQRHQRRTSNASGFALGGRSLPHGLGVDESEASDTGMEGDRDEAPPRPLRYPNRTRSVTHLPSQTQLHLSANSPPSSDTGHSGDDAVRSPAQQRASIHSPPPLTIRRPATSVPSSTAASSAIDASSSSPLAQFAAASPIFGSMPEALGVNPGYFPLTSNPADFLPTPQQLWQLHQAALGLSLGMGVGAHHTQAEADHLNEFLAPPPPYQANDSNAEAVQAARDSVNRMEMEQAEASVGRSLQSRQGRNDGADADDADVITFHTRGDSARRRNSGYRDSDHSRSHPTDDGSALSRAGSLSRRRAAGIPHSLSRVQVPRSDEDDDDDDERRNDVSPASPSSPDVRSATSGGEEYDSEYPASPPAWLPKSDTELETDVNDTEAERADSPNGFTSSYAPGRGTNRRTWASRAMSRSRSGGSSSRSFRRSTRMSTSSLVHHLAALDEEEAGPSLWLLVWLLHPLRLLAAVPGTVGTYWLIRNARLHLEHSGSLLVRGPLDPGAPNMSNPFRLTCGLDFLLASLWALSTAYHALSLTTLLLRRWLVYYSLLPSLIRLIALQSICWPLVRLTIFVAGPDRPIEAWIIIASFTALSDVVARWVTSNIADAPSPPPRARKRPGQERSSRRWQKRAQAKSEDEDGQDGMGEVVEILAEGARPGASDCGSGGGGSAALPNGDAQHHTINGSDWPQEASAGGNASGEAAVGGGDDADAPERGALGANPGQRFWRAVMGAPIDSSTSDSDSDDIDERLLDAPLGSIEGLEDIDETDALEDDGQAEGGEGLAALQGGEGGDGDGDAAAADEQRRLGAVLARRRRRHRMRLKMAALSSGMGMGGLGGLGLSVTPGEGSSGSAAGATSPGAAAQNDGSPSTPLAVSGAPTAAGAATAVEPRTFLTLRRRHDGGGAASQAQAQTQTSSQTQPQSQSRSHAQPQPPASQHQPVCSPAPASVPARHLRGSSLARHDGITPRVRIRSRRVFHWEVAMKRNVAPLGVLAYVTLWGLLLGGVGRREGGVALHGV